MLRPLLPVQFVLALASMAHAQGPDSVVAPLRGIREIRVVVESLHTSSVHLGLVAAELQGDVERQLRELGIAVAAPRGRGPYLYLRVTTRQEPERGYPFLVELLLRDSVRLVRDTMIIARATTWTRTRGSYLTYSERRDELARDIREAIKAMVERFGDDWKLANGR